jgi:hypothetical protein
METNQIPSSDHKSNKAAFTILGVGLAAALAGDAYLISRSNHLSEDLARTQSGAQIQIAKVNETTSSLIQQERARLDSVSQQVAQQVKGVHESAAAALKRTRAEVEKEQAELSRTLAEQNQQVATQLTGQITELKDTTSSKFTAVSTDVDGVKQNVESVKTSVAATQADLEKTGAELHRVMGDMGVMSGLIATNSTDLDKLKALGERNYIEFKVDRKGQARVGDLTIALKKADPKHNRFTMDVLADDKHVEKKDRTINEPVQLYVSGSMQPYEIVVNEVKKDQIVGYLATPKVKTQRRGQAASANGGSNNTPAAHPAS